MGRKAGGLYINLKKFGSLIKPCMKDTMMFLNCLSLNHNNDEKCIRQKDQLNVCMDAQAGKKKNAWGAVNYHLQRLSKGRKLIGFVAEIVQFSHAFEQEQWKRITKFCKFFAALFMDFG